jgi:hypothetical protein
MMRFSQVLKSITTLIVIGATMPVLFGGAFKSAGTIFDAGFFPPAQLFDENTNVYGMQLSPFMTENRNVYGISTGFTGCSDSAYGIQAGMLNITDDIQAGLTAGIYNSAGKELFGMQAGLYNQTGANFYDKTAREHRNAYGSQIGMVNHSQSIFRGFQVGIVNMSDSILKGLQFGIVNVTVNDDGAFEDYDSVAEDSAQNMALKKAADKSRRYIAPSAKADEVPLVDQADAIDQSMPKPFCIQFGFINFNKRGFLPVFPIINF